MKTKLMMVGLMLSVFYIGCEEEAAVAAVDCTPLTDAAATAGLAFTTDPTTANCGLYKTALDAVVAESTCDSDGNYAAMIATLGDCSAPGDALDCVNKLLSVTEAGLAYAMSETEATCTAYKDALNAAIAGQCDDDGTLAATLADLPDDCADAGGDGGRRPGGTRSLSRIFRPTSRND